MNALKRADAKSAMQLNTPLSISSWKSPRPICPQSHWKGFGTVRFWRKTDYRLREVQCCLECRQSLS